VVAEAQSGGETAQGDGMADEDGVTEKLAQEIETLAKWGIDNRQVIIEINPGQSRPPSVTSGRAMRWRTWQVKPRRQTIHR
jgi:hypothetical protein